MPSAVFRTTCSSTRTASSSPAGSSGRTWKNGSPRYSSSSPSVVFSAENDYLCYLNSNSMGMDFTQAKQRIEQLKAVLWENSRKYYVENAPTMSDYEYDQLMHELEDLERQ
ncbi:MAG: hypothetical protein IKP01_01610, partial [Bacteroidales bacterium]|nr:hypothetical protein [Bacteroidales bacterium]